MMSEEGSENAEQGEQRDNSASGNITKETGGDRRGEGSLEENQKERRPASQGLSVAEIPGANHSIDVPVVSIPQETSVVTIPSLQKTTTLKQAEGNVSNAQKEVVEKNEVLAEATMWAQVFPAVPGKIQELLSDAREAGDQLVAATEELEMRQYQSRPYEAVFMGNSINSFGQTTIYGKSDHNLADEKETAPRTQSVPFPYDVCRAIQEAEESDLMMLFQTGGDRFDEMRRDLMRATFELNDQNGKTTTLLGSTAKERFNQIMSFIGQNQYLRIAIANLMYQRGLATLELLSLGLLPESSLQEAWKPELMGPIRMQLLDRTQNSKTEVPAYYLDKSNHDGEQIFTLTMNVVTTGEFSNISWKKVQLLNFSFEVNANFDEKLPFSKNNNPVILSCNSGNITWSFDDKRTQAQQDAEEAEYNYNVAQKKKDLPALELTLAQLWRNLKKAEYDMALAQDAYAKAKKNAEDAPESLAVQPLYTRGGLIVSDNKDAKKALKAAREKLQHAESFLQTTQETFHMIMPARPDAI